MKQNITVEQLQELSPKAKDRLEAWMSEKGYWTTTMFHLGPFIGQMIEFLDEKAQWFNGIGRLQPYSWSTGMLTDPTEDSEPQFVERHCDRELVDVLWQAVKERLEL